MPDAEDRIVAIQAVIDQIQPDIVPLLTTGEIELAVDRARLCSTRQPGTAYKIGDVVVPEIRNGHAYQCIQPGTSGGALAYRDWPTVTGSRKVDGDSDPQLVWLEVGHDRFNAGIMGAETNVYDIGRACRELCSIKIRRSAELVDDGDTSFSQVHKNWKEQLDRFVPFYRQARLVRC